MFLAVEPTFNLFLISWKPILRFATSVDVQNLMNILEFDTRKEHHFVSISRQEYVFANAFGSRISSLALDSPPG
jgi:hypothetical protein